MARVNNYDQGTAEERIKAAPADGRWKVWKTLTGDEKKRVWASSRPEVRLELMEPSERENRTPCCAALMGGAWQGSTDTEVKYVVSCCGCGKQIEKRNLYRPAPRVDTAALAANDKPEQAEFMAEEGFDDFS